MSLCVYAIYVYWLVNTHLVMLYCIFDTINETQILSTVSSVENHIVAVFLDWCIQYAYNLSKALGCT